MLVGAAAAVLAAVLIGFPTFRLAGIYFALATLAYPLILRIFMDFLGYQEVAIPMIRERAWVYMQFLDPRAYNLLVLAAFLAVFWLSHAIERSRLGYWLRALKENEPAAEAMGVDTFRCKMAAYMLSAAPAAIIGAIYAHAVLFVVTPDAVFGLLVIVQTLVVCLVGGAGSKWGPLLGAAITEYIEMKPFGNTKVAFGTSAPAAPTTGGGDVKAIGTNHFVIKRADLQKHLNDLSSILMQARAVQARDKVTGEIIGYRIVDFQPNSIFSQLGIQRMDLIKTVNGEPVDTPQKAMELFNMFKSAPNIKMTVDRGGSTETLDYDIK
jgi:hypothetical protein